MSVAPFSDTAKIVSALHFFVERTKHSFQQKKPFFRARHSIKEKITVYL